MNKNGLFLLLGILLTFSLSANLYLLRNLNIVNSATDVKQTDVTLIPETIHRFKKHDLALLSVYVLPHPPDFLEGRQIFFKDYRIESVGSKQIIIFNEKKEGKWIETKVNSEAVQWK